MRCWSSAVASFVRISFFSSVYSFLSGVSFLANSASFVRGGVLGLPGCQADSFPGGEGLPVELNLVAIQHQSVMLTDWRSQFAKYRMPATRPGVAK